MRLPLSRGPISGHVLGALVDDADTTVNRLPVDVDEPGIIHDADAQLALWTLYELHYRGFDDVPDDREWDSAFLETRRTLERPFEEALRNAVRGRLEALATGGDVVARLTDLIECDDGPPVAAFLHRHASRDQLLDFLRERSVQQLKESDSQSFVLPRLRGQAKVGLAELQYDEYGAGRAERLHQTLYADALLAAGLDSTYGAYIDEVSAITLANANAMSLFGLHRRLRGMAVGHLAAFEATSSVPSRRIACGVERVRLPDAVGVYFEEHVEADSVHEQVAMHDICAALVADEPDLREDVLMGAAVCLHLAGLSAGELLERWSPSLEVAS